LQCNNIFLNANGILGKKMNAYAFCAGTDIELLDERLCCVIVRVLASTTSPEVSEMCLDFLHGQAEKGKYKYYVVCHGMSLKHIHNS
jgi:hypothetical protein